MTHSKRRLNIAAIGLLVAALALTGCSSDDHTASPASKQEAVALALGEETEVFSGDQVLDTGGDTRIRVRHDDASDRKFVTLLSGSAELIQASD
ncbi:MAG: hypothetical protein R3175_06535 [Marinobacter sp.]|uniref:hypothetical protein n=1 Tax=Marinobacter sp. TaxID=50741 RepID=UPI00299D7F67|nr:hypothetical protein [Marinobacter sp.]MDX1755696.1 hypothetical protein [Marinobacter sp.]